jgi:predicted ester cyclase
MILDTLVAEEDRVAFWGKFSGTQDGPMGPFPPTGRRLESEIGGMFRIEAGRIAELWVTWDNLSGLAQLGHFPPPE